MLFNIIAKILPIGDFTALQANSRRIFAYYIILCIIALMEALSWVTEHSLDLVQTVCIVGGLAFTAYTIKKDEQARRIGNLIAINEQYRDIWNELYERPQLIRVLKGDVDLTEQPISDQERLFVKLLIFHLNDVYRAIKAKMFVRLEGVQKDVKEFFSAPIPKSVWEKIKPYQDNDFVQFIERSIA